MGFDYARKRKKLIFILAAFGFTSYGAYRVYHLPSVVRKRKRLSILLGAFISVAEAVSESAETVGVVSRDMKEFLQSNSDKIPNSLKQISKITSSNEFSDSLTSVTQALTLGVLRGYQSKTRIDRDENSANSSFIDQVMDKLFTTAGSGFVSVVVGSFARSLIMALYSDRQPSEKSNSSNYSTSADHGGSDLDSLPRWVNVVSDDKCRELICDCIQLFASTAVAVYLDKTMHINTYDEFFPGLTNPKHGTQLRDMLVSVCNGTVETLVRTSHQVIRSSDPNSASSYLIIDESPIFTRNEDLGQKTSSVEMESKSSNLSAEEKKHGWVSKVSSALSVPRNRRFVLDVTGRVTFATVRSFMEFLLEKLYNGLKRCANFVHEAVTENGLQIVRYAAAKTSVLATLCFTLYFHVVGGVWLLMPA